MAIRSFSTKVAILELLLVSTLMFNMVPPRVDAKISCEEMTMLLTPCISYAVLGVTVAPGCCDGIKKSLQLVKTKQDLRDKCQCVKDGAAGIPGLSYERVNELPGICGIPAPYVVSPDTDCSKIG